MKNSQDNYQLSSLQERFNIFLKNQYRSCITKIRFSIILQLNINYFFVVLKYLFWVNVLISIVYSYFTFDKIYNNMQTTCNTISKIVSSGDNREFKKLQLIKDINGYEIIIYNKDKKILNGSTVKNTYSLSKNSIKIFNKGYLQFKKVNINNLKINYVYEKPIKYDGETLYIQLSYNLYADLRILLKFIGVVICGEIICLLLSLAKIKCKNQKTLKPLYEMTNTVKNITIKEIDTRLNVSGSQNELKDLARTFNNMLDRIEQAYNIQNQFVSDASHELRTPIAVIQGYAKLLDRWGKEDKDVLDESIEAIKSEATNMKDLVEKLLFLARSDKNTQQISIEEFNLNEIIDVLVKETKLIDNDHTIECNGNDKIKINADAKLIKQALRIFVDNCIKYTPRGGMISISSKVKEDSIEIVIKDTGIGINREDIPKIFDRFYRADKSRTRETGGNGLGLSIAKWIIMKHKGGIIVESAINVGTTIKVKLPFDCS